MYGPATTDALDLLATAPGPSPWYLDLPGSRLQSARRPLVWQALRSDKPFIGKTALTDADAHALAVLGMYCWVKPLAEGRMLCWWHEDDPTLGEVGRNRLLRIVLVDLGRLEPIADLAATCTAMDDGDLRAHIPAGIVASTTLGAGFDAGSYDHELPPAMRSLDELIILDAQGGLRLLVIDPAAGRFEVFPQDWFNEGNFDVGYQWVTRLVRDRATGVIVGDGIRLGAFALDESNRRIARWYVQDPFYGPRG